jgi:hypothetical protein
MLGWLTNSLSYQTRKALRAWKQSNPIVQEYQYNIFEKFFIRLALLPVRDAFLLLIFIFCLLLPAIPFVWRIYPIEFLLNRSGIDLDKPNYLGTLWEIQATLVGLVYPIVIGFIALLLQNKTSEIVILKNYLIDSCALFMSLSSLCLVGFIGF